MMNKKSSELFQKAKTLFPGGVHSPVRSFKGLEISPLFFEKGDGAKLTSIEGKDYIDFCMSFGPLILGHKDPEVEEEVRKALSRGWSFGACEPYSLELAELILQRIPFIDQIRFVNSGTEAVMTALRLARGYTGRNKVIKFNGCYHGHCDSMLLKSGSGLAGQGEASSAGVPPGVIEDTLILDLGDRQGVEKCFSQWGNEIAAVIIEPLPANYGLLIQEDGFLHFLREITRRHQALFIADEVISGFRTGFTGMSGRLNLAPDLVTYGKIIGGGMPVGAVAGKKDILENLAPIGPVYQAGTLSANPLAMVAGQATLRKLTPAIYGKIGKYTEDILKTFKKYIAEKGLNASFVHQDSLFWVTDNGDGSIRSIKDIPPRQSEIFNPFFADLLQKGIYLAPNAYEVGFVSLAHDHHIRDELEKRLWER